jgi:predicted DNA repair protein MutK
MSRRSTGKKTRKLMRRTMRKVSKFAAAALADFAGEAMYHGMKHVTALVKDAADARDKVRREVKDVARDLRN